jgi:hypothetical protein
VVSILADFRWSFSTLSGGLTGILPALSTSGPSQLLLDLYAQANPGYTYQYIGGTQSGPSVPEPMTAALLGPVAAMLSVWRCRDVKRNPRSVTASAKPTAPAATNKPRIERMRIERHRLQFRMILHAHEPWMLRQLDRLRQHAIRGYAGKQQPSGLQDRRMFTS